MKIYFAGDLTGLEEGIAAIAKDLGIELAAEGLEVRVEKNPYGKIEVRKAGDRAAIRYPQKVHFFRALGLLLEALQERETFDIIEEPQFDTNGIMIDVSQGNAVTRPEVVKKLLNTMAVMGLNLLMLYMEDSYTIPEEPYFGYMRSRYTFNELRELDDYANQFGIEIIPAIQTLAHLVDVLKWNRFGSIKEDDDTLLVGDPGTYEFVEVMIRNASRPFRSKRIHIGLDEAWHLGRGKYLELYGLKSTFEIMTEHLKKVVDITEKYGLKPMMWSDMYFRTPALSGYGNNYDPEVRIPEGIIDTIPHSVQMVFWEYNRDDVDFYTKVIDKHRELGRDPLFAGGIWNWMGFGVNYGITFRTTQAALKACKEKGIREVYATLWGDDATENNLFSTLLGMQLYAELGYARELNMEKLERRFKFCTGGNFQDFMNIKYLDETPGVVDDNMAMRNPSKFLLWQNILMGLYDRETEGLGLGRHYSDLRHTMKSAIGRNGRYDFLFELFEKVCSVLEIKAELGIELTRAYKAGDRGTLTEIAASILPELKKRVEELRSFHRDLWYKTNKPFGWEILDLRYGLLLMNIDTARMRIDAYLDGAIDHIEELEEERLYANREGELSSAYRYKYIPSASRISQ